MKLITEAEIDEYIKGDLRRVSNCINVAYLIQQARLGYAYVENQEKGVALLIERKDFYSLYYFLAQPEVLKLPLTQKEIFCEVFSRQDNGGADVLEASGFSKYSSYCRMSKKGTEGIAEEHEVVKKGTMEIIQAKFDHYADCLPAGEEQELFMKENFEICAFGGKGILIYDIKDFVSTLKYIFVDETDRNKGIAGALLEEYLKKTAGSAKRYLLWVNEQNRVALNLYNKYGYRTDGFKKMVWKR